LKADKFGGEVWSHTYDLFDGGEYGFVVRVHPDDGYVMAGYGLSSSGSHQAFLLRTDANGEELWHHTYAGNNDDTASDMILTSDGGIILAEYLLALP